jgi:hypothetical protein
MSVSKHIPKPIKRVSRSLGYALWLDGQNDWFGLSVILKAHLDERQRAALAYMALRSLNYEQAVAVTETILPEGTGAPIAPLFNHMDEAAFWADMAEPEALEAYCLASFNAMPAPRKAAFLEFVQGRQVA